MEFLIHSVFLTICGLLLYITTTSALPESSHVQPRLIPRSLPPTPKTNGICYTYTIQARDTCQSLSQAYQITVTEIETWNTGNYGYKGCNNIKQGDFICLSSGAPPMPVALPHATCGPQVPGTARPNDYLILSSLNPCPSGHCCTSDGQCSSDSNTCTSEICIANCGQKSRPSKSTAQAPPPPTQAAPQPTSKTTVTLNKTYIKTTTKVATITVPTTTSTFSSSETTTTPAQTTNHSTTTEHAIPAAWTLAAYKGSSCDGDYFVVQGHQSSDDKCLKVSTLNPDYTDTGVWCRWYQAGGFNMTSCDNIYYARDEEIFSWRMTGGTCTAYEDETCDVWKGNFIADITDGECQTERFYHPHMLMQWLTLKCKVNVLDHALAVGGW